MPTWASSTFPTSILNRPRRGRAVLISGLLRTSRPKSFGVRPYPVCERRKKNQNLRRGPVKPKRGAHLTRSGVGWSQLRAPGPQNRSGGRKKNPFLCTECSFLALSSAGTDPGRCRDRMAARLHFGFFSTAGARRDPANCKIRYLGTKKDWYHLSIVFVRSGGSWSRDARYSEGAGARCDARADLRFEATPKNH